MTDPVDTDAQPFLDQHNADARRVAATADTAALRTQALRNQAADVRADATEAEQDWLDVADSLEAAADEVDRLRAAIENAPHAPGCPTGHVVAAKAPCTCWKADAL